MLLGVTVNSRSDTTNEHKLSLYIHVKVNKSTNFQQLNRICVTVSSEKVLKLTQFQLIPHTLLGVTVNSQSDKTNEHKLSLYM